jgi:hypothetical protein
MEESFEFQVSMDELEYLKELASGDESVASLLGSLDGTPSGRVTVLLTRSEAERVRDRLTTELAARGFDQNYSPNNLGRMVEGLIDRFYVA